MKNKQTGQKGTLFTRRDWAAAFTTLTAGLTALGTGSRIFSAEAAGESEAPVQLKDFSQVAFVVKDIEAWCNRIAALFGVNVPKANLTGARDKAHTVYRGAPTEARAKLAFFRLGQITLELIEPDSNPSTWREGLEKNGDGLHHIAFRVTDMDKALAYLKQKGCEVIQTGDFTGGSYAYVDTMRTLGCVIELLISKKV